MTQLLSLPLKIRETILDYVLDHPRPPPLNPWTGTAQKRRPLYDMKYKSWHYGHSYTKYEPSEQKASSLFLVNRQIHNEATDILNRRDKSCYELDVMFINRWEMWPTWLSGYVPETNLDELKVTFRIFGHCLHPKKIPDIQGRYRSSGIKWCFYALLERFLVHGPRGMSYEKTEEERMEAEKKETKVQKRERDRTLPWKEKRFFIKMLVLDFKACPDEESPLPPPEATRGDYAGYLHDLVSSTAGPVDENIAIDMSNYIMRPEWLAKEVENGIKQLLGMSYHTLKYGGILYEHIGKIKILVDGELRTEFDMAERLGSLRWDPHNYRISEEKREYFWRWKRQALRKREQAGFPVIPLEDPEFEGYPEQEE